MGHRWHSAQLLWLQVSGVVVGEGFRFGYKAMGDTQMLQELGAAQGMDVSIVSLVSDVCTEGPETVRACPLHSLRSPDSVAPLK